MLAPSYPFISSEINPQLTPWIDSAYPPALPVSALKPRETPSSRYRRSSSPRTPAKLAQDLIAAAAPSRATLAQRRQKTLQDLERMDAIRDLERQSPRRWRPGDVYAPHDLSPVEMQKWKNSKPGEKDVFDVLGINPLDEWKNVSILGNFVTPLGRIMHRKDTGLRAVNQRKIAKAIRRAVAMGMMSSVHKHPEILENEERKRNERRFGPDGRSGIVKQ